jgi:hypothetical protein
MSGTPSVTNWTGNAGTSDYNTPGNWDAGVPSTTTSGQITGTSDAFVSITYTGLNDTALSLTAVYATFSISSGSLALVQASSLDGVAISGGLLEFENIGGVASSISGAVADTGGTLQMDSGTLTVSGTSSFGADGNYGPYLEGPGTLLTSGTANLVAQTGYDYPDLYVGLGAIWSNSGAVSDAGQIAFGVEAFDSGSFVN